jgi:hypothetical protein
MDAELRQVIDELKTLINSFKESLTGLPVVGTVTPAAPPELPYPRVVEFDGAKFLLYRPINPKWKTSQAGKMFGKNMTLDDPSLATTPDGYPSRSPAGYPLVYPFVKDGKPYRDAVILFGENTFPNDAAVEEYIKATTPTAEDMERARKQWEEYDAALKKRAEQGNTTPPVTPPSVGRPNRHGGFGSGQAAGGGTVVAVDPPVANPDDIYIV